MKQTFKQSLIAIALISICTSAGATEINNGSNHHNNNGDTYNSTHNQGGTGIGVGVGVGIAGATSASQSSANSNNINTNSNTNHNANTNFNHNSNGQTQTQGQGQHQRANASQGQNQSTENANNSNQSVNVEGDSFEYKRNPVSTAYAPSIAPTANCALSVSGGVQAIGFGASFGKAYIDENCAALEKVRSVAQVLGDVKTAEAMLCQDVKYAKARATAGRPCPVEQE